MNGMNAQTGSVERDSRCEVRAAGVAMWENVDHNKAAPRRCVNTVDPRGLADWIGVD